ncbi:ABC transporter substrate-binding protein [Mangrovimicrobium sediminis]|uniref:ABC transporter substrate-binding protein n=1 Tax=Mangrovimicrobium sediminis TaxID=2562682 RepID=UPI001436ACAA|nr:ABC transporter substrate-binding protein [Haliea sp. SAOS-164]
MPRAARRQFPATRRTRCIALLLGCLAMAGANARDDVFNFTLPWLPVGDYAYYTAGIALGYYRDVGIDLRVKRGFGSIDATTKLAAGLFDAGEVDIAAVISGRLQQQTPVKCIASNQTVSPGGFLVLKSSGIETLQDLVGKTIATQPGNAMFLYLPMLAAQQGFDATRIQRVNVDNTAMAGLLLRGKVDAAAFLVTNEPFLDRQAQRFGKSVRAIRYADYGLDIYGQCIAAPDEVIANKPDLLRRFLQATLRARRFALENPEETVALHHAAYPEVDPEDALLSLRAALPYMFNPVTEAAGLGQFAPARVQATYDAVVKSQALQGSAPLEAFVDDSLVRDLESAGD